MNRSKRIVAFGELLWDLLPGGRTLGGAPANFAFRAKTLGHRTSLITRIGTDALGAEGLQRLQSLNADTECIQTDDSYPTGTVQVTLGTAGPEYFIVQNVAYDHIERTPEAIAALREADCFCFGTLIQRAEKSRHTLYKLLEQVRGLRVLDLNLRNNCYTRDTVQKSMAHADILKMNDAEAVELPNLAPLGGPDFESLCRSIFQSYPIHTILITLGANGAFAATRKGENIHVPGHAVEVCDTCGSGDAFTAAFVDAYLNGASLETACRRGNALGSLVATKRGATAPISPSEVDDLLAR